jgi:hypothetical protein
MKPRRQVLLGIAAFAAAGCGAFGDTAAPGSGDPLLPHDDIRLATNLLLRSDSSRIAALEQKQSKGAATSAPAGTVVMSPYILREPSDRDVAMPRYETPAMRFLRDGTLYSHIGPRYSTRAFLRFYRTEDRIGGNVPPVNGVQLAFVLAW